MLNLKSEVVIVSVFVFVGLASQAFAVNSWYWTGGNKTENKPGLYPPSTGGTGLPGARYQSMYCTDPSGVFWLFGGYGYGQAGTIKGYLGDLWSFNTATETWTWASGSPLPNYAGSYPARTGSAGIPGARASGALFCDGNGDVWLFGGLGNTGELGDFWQYSHSDGSWTLQGGSDEVSVAGTDSGIFGEGYPGSRSQAAYWTYGSTFFMFGGKTSAGYMDDFWTYQVGSIINSWEFLGGPNDENDAGELPENFGEHGTPGSRGYASTWIDKNGILWLYGGWANNNEFLADLWSYNPVSGFWTFVGGSETDNEAPVYPSGLGVAGGSPGSRAGASAWFVAGQPAYIFGGRDNKVYQDLWAYNALKKNWTYTAGSESLNAAGTFPKVIGGSGTPTSRYWAASWTDSSNQLWLFGGISGVDSSILNDLWTSSSNAASFTTSTKSAASSSTVTIASSTKASTSAVAASTSSTKATTTASTSAVASSTKASTTAAASTVTAAAKASSTSSSTAKVASSTSTSAKATSTTLSSATKASAR